MKTTKRTCVHCNSTFLADNREINRGNAKYCGLSCATAHSNSKRRDNMSIDNICKHCGVPFKSLYKTAQYCSSSCKSKNYRLKKKSGNMFDRQLEKLVKENPCEICNWSEAPRDSHHIIGVSKGGKSTINNLISLCPNHHRSVHYNLISQDHLLEVIKSRTISSSLEALLVKIRSKEQDAKSGN